MRTIFLSFVMVLAGFATASAAEDRRLPLHGFLVLNTINAQEINVHFNYKVFWDSSVCGFMIVHASEFGSLSSLKNEFEITGSAPVETSVLPHTDQLIFKISEPDRGRHSFVLKAKSGTIQEAVAKVLNGPDDQVILMFSRNCVGMP